MWHNRLHKPINTGSVDQRPLGLVSVDFLSFYDLFILFVLQNTPSESLLPIESNGVFFPFMVRGMSTPQKTEHDIHYADTQHPVEH